MTTSSRIAASLWRCRSLWLALTLAGCGNMSGLGGSSEYACKAPPGVRCTSLSGVFHNAVKNNLPSQHKGATARKAKGNTRDNGPRLVLQPAGQALAATSLRAEGKVLRLWIKPWEDTDNDLVDQSYVYLQVERARWQVDHIQRRARAPYAPLPAAPKAAAPADNEAGPEQPPPSPATMTPAG